MKRKPEGTPRLPFDPHRVRGGDRRAAAGDDGSLDGGFNAEGETSSVRSAAAKSDDATISVSELTRLIKGAIQTVLPGDVRVLGELSNISRPSGGHIYFTLKDAGSEVRCVMWRSSAQSLKFDMQDGLEVIATGSVDVYEPRGQYQLYVRRLAPCGVGALELAFQQLKEKLAKAGLFDPGRKRPLPAHPRTIALVTSPTGAAVRDMLQTIERRFPKATVYVFGVRVQGDGAAAEIADAIRRINVSRETLGGVDVMIVGRGGGSLEDLWAFNEEAVARAIYESKIPIVSAVGHEVDFTIADFVADVRAATPTAAAELVAPLLSDLITDLEGLRRRLSHGVRRRSEAAGLRLAALERTAWFRDPVGQVRRIDQEIDELLGRLRLSLARRIHHARSRIHRLEVRLVGARPTVQLARRRERLAKIERRLERGIETSLHAWERRVRGAELRMASTSPRQRLAADLERLRRLDVEIRRAAARALAERMRRLAVVQARMEATSHESVLNRGYSITRRARDGSVIRAADAVREGDKLTTETADGKISSRVLDERQGELFG